MPKSIQLHPDSLASARVGQAKKVVVYSTGNIQILTDASSNVGCLVRVISVTGSSKVLIGDTNMTADASTSPGAIVLIGVDTSKSINFSGDLYGRTDAGTATLAIAPLLVDGYAGDQIS